MTGMKISTSVSFILHQALPEFQEFGLDARVVAVGAQAKIRLLPLNGHSFAVLQEPEERLPRPLERIRSGLVRVGPTERPTVLRRGDNTDIIVSVSQTEEGQSLRIVAGEPFRQKTSA